MKTALKWMAGFGAVAPILIMAIDPITRFVWILMSGNAVASELDAEIRIAFGLIGLGVTAVFVGIALRSEAVPNEKRKLWVAVLLFGNFLVLPFFWFWYVLPAENYEHTTP